MNGFSHRALAFATLLLLLLAAGCMSSSEGSLAGVGSKPAAAPPASGDRDLRVVSELPVPEDTAGGTERPIAPGDILEVSVFQVPDLSRTAQVDSVGRVSLPLIGVIPAAGKSVRTFENDVKIAYGRDFLQSPQVSVLVKESAANRVTVDGEVRRAGVFPLPPSASLLDAVALAGGFSPVADEKKVYVFRQAGSQKLVANYDVSAIKSGRRNAPNLYGGDVVVVFPSSSRVAFQNLKEALGVATSVGRLTAMGL
ncbi:polysaccharide biosynthesis/export family protein [Mesorhizobium australicum]|uniref:Polysaccharide export outer membrane protein n=1 Tax=Mesorhizobium australicum TaxID=536018 RepID=A0A1X7NSZ9_9HYPH|nr:polysaccharide biosynthesis/export family protein [Mesorhizobium australicum]SMH40817.1 polysaccharide export outer membrane protein [Mesorhizobium australicum]